MKPLSFLLAVSGLAALASAAPQNLDGLDLRTLVGRGRAVPGSKDGQGNGANSAEDEEKVEPVAILKQINE